MAQKAGSMQNKVVVLYVLYNMREIGLPVVVLGRQATLPRVVEEEEASLPPLA